MASGSPPPKVFASCSRDEGDRDGLVVTERQHGLAHLGVLWLVGQRHYRAGKGGQRVGKLVVAVDARQLFQQINFALDVEPPGRDLHAEVAAGCARDAETQAAQDALDLALRLDRCREFVHLRATQHDGRRSTLRATVSISSPCNSPPALARINSATRSQASGVMPQSAPRSKRCEASVCMPWRLAMLRTVAGSNHADSMSTFFVAR